LLTLGSLLALFWVLDSQNFRKAPPKVAREQTSEEKWRFDGLHNFAFIAVIIAAVLWNQSLPLLIPELIMILAAVGSYLTTHRSVHEANDFQFGPIKEVAWLFLGIFATMVPALDYLGKHAGDLGVTTAVQFYFATGILSAFLDNAPTYLTFLSAELGLHGLSIDNRADVLADIAARPDVLLAISLGAVFFGAMSYIGNGPNLMVKAIADQSKVQTPSFFAYIFRFAIPYLLPILILIGVLFFSPWRLF
jgi:Na+/H+ antiporter NhaD/arsenite permease-like protein